MNKYQAILCEDQIEELNYIANKLEEAFMAHDMDVTFLKYQSGVDLLKDLEENKALNLTDTRLFFLDIEMPQINGIQLCKKIRVDFPDSLVIFISNREEMVFQTFEVSPFRFIRKGHFSEELPALVTAIIRELQERQDAEICIQELHSNNIFTWKAKSIISVEAQGKYCLIKTAKDISPVQYRFKDIQDLLEPYGFIQAHRSFLANYRFISRIEGNDIIMEDNSRIPISRGKATEVRKAFIKLVNSTY